MDSFFTRIQNKFDASYGGRYIETILKEISIEDERISKFLSKTKERCRITTEHRFFVNGKERIADIAIESVESNEIAGLVEIKYDDHLNEKNHAQLADYIDYCRAKSLSFIYLTQYYPPKQDIDLVKESGFSHILFSQLALELNKKNTNQVTQLFISYLEDRGLIMKNIKTESIYKLLVRLFTPISNQGKIQNNKAMIDEIPSALQALMNNMSILSIEISRYVDVKRIPVIDFRFWPSFKFTKKDLRELLDDEDHSGYLGMEKNGGEMCIFAQSVIIDTNDNKDDYLYIRYGYSLIIEKGQQDYTTFLYAQIFGKDINDPDDNLYFRRKIGNSILSKKDRCVPYLSELISSASDEALIYTNSTTYKTALKTLSGTYRQLI